MTRRFAGLWALTLIVALIPVAAAHGAASLSLQPSSWDFGARDPGTGPSDPAVFTLTNTGNVAVDVYAAGVGWFGPVGSDPELFVLGDNDCFEPVALAPGASCTVEVSFNPSTPGPKKGLVSLTGCHPSPTDCQPSPVSARSDLAGLANGPYVVEEPQPPGPPPVSPTARARVSLLRHPPHLTTGRSALFRFRSRRAVKFVCRLDRRRARPCASPLRLARLAPGRHRLVIRAIEAYGRLGPARRFRWRILP